MQLCKGGDKLECTQSVTGVGSLTQDIPNDGKHGSEQARLRSKIGKSKLGELFKNNVESGHKESNIGSGKSIHTRFCKSTEKLTCI